MVVRAYNSDIVFSVLVERRLRMLPIWWRTTKLNLFTLFHAMDAQLPADWLFSASRISTTRLITKPSVYSTCFADKQFCITTIFGSHSGYFKVFFPASFQFKVSCFKRTCPCMHG